MARTWCVHPPLCVAQGGRPCLGHDGASAAPTVGGVAPVGCTLSGGAGCGVGPPLPLRPASVRRPLSWLRGCTLSVRLPSRLRRACAGCVAGAPLPSRPWYAGCPFLAVTLLILIVNGGQGSFKHRQESTPRRPRSSTLPRSLGGRVLWSRGSPRVRGRVLLRQVAVASQD